MVSTKTKKILKMQYEIYKSITKKAVYVLKPVDCFGRKHLKDALKLIPMLPLKKSPFHDTKVVKQELNSHKYDEWNRKWQNAQEGVQTKMWLPQIDLSLTKSLLQLTRVTLGLCIQFITGHNWLLRHKRYYLKNPTMDQTCRLCNENESREDAIHLWSKCKALKRQRDIVQGINTTQVILETPFQWLPSQLARFLREPNIGQLLEGPGED